MSILLSDNRLGLLKYYCNEKVMDKFIFNEKVISDTSSNVVHEDEGETAAAHGDLKKESLQYSQPGRDVDLSVNEFLSDLGVSIR